MRPLMLLLGVACAPEATEDPTPTACGDGFLRAADGNCYPIDAGGDDDEDTGGAGGGDEAPSVEDVLAALPPCGPLEPGEGLDLAAGCADGACFDGDYDAWEAALGPAQDCSSYRFETEGYAISYLSCSWAAGVWGTFDDEDADEEPDPGVPAGGVSVSSPFDGVSAEGLALGLPTSCFVEALGTPDVVEFSRGEREMLVSYASWEEAGVVVFDRYTERAYGPDGVVDGLALYGARDGGGL